MSLKVLRGREEGRRWEEGVGGNLGLVDGREGRRGRRISCLAFHRERRDDGVRHLVQNIERLEGRDRRDAAGLRLDDEDFLFAVHHLGRRRRSTRAMVRPVRVGPHADAAVLRGTSRETRVAGAMDASFFHRISGSIEAFSCGYRRSTVTRSMGAVECKQH